MRQEETPATPDDALPGNRGGCAVANYGQGAPPQVLSPVWYPGDLRVGNATVVVVEQIIDVASAGFFTYFSQGHAWCSFNKTEPTVVTRAMGAFYCGGQNVSVCRWKRVLACACFAASMTSETVIAGSTAQDRVQAGLWEVTFVQDGAPSTSTYCITPAAARVMNSDAATISGLLATGSWATYESF